MADVEVYIDLDGTPRPVGLLRRHASRREETVTFEYGETWLANDERFSIEPALALTRGVFPPPPDQPIFGSIGDSAPDTLGAPPHAARGASTCRTGRAPRPHAW